MSSFLSLYSAGSIMEIVLGAIGSIFWMYRTMRASRIIHANLLESIFTSTFRYCLHLFDVWSTYLSSIT